MRVLMTAAALMTAFAWGAPARNAALNRPVQVSGRETPHDDRFRGEYAVDGDRSSNPSRWSSAEYKKSPQWISVDLGKIEKLHGAILVWEKSRSVDYELQGRNDESEEWKTFHHEVKPDKTKGGTDRIEFSSPVSARFVRMLSNKANGAWCTFSLYELELYADAMPKKPLAERIAKWTRSPATRLQLPHAKPGDKVVLTEGLAEDWECRIVGSASEPIISDDGTIRRVLPLTVDLCAEVRDRDTDEVEYVNVPVKLGTSHLTGILPVIPQVQCWQPAEGSFVRPLELNVLAKGEAARDVADVFVEDFSTLFGKGSAAVSDKGEILFAQVDDASLGDEGYQLKIDASGILIQAHARGGLFAGAMTLLQLFDAAADKKTIAAGEVLDWPRYGIRGALLDIGRMPFTLDFLRQQVRMLAYHKFNMFHLHLNDNGFASKKPEDSADPWKNVYQAFRLECETFPGLTAKDCFYTKREFRDFQRFALRHGITIVPEFDAPAHALAFSRCKPELASKRFGPDHLDLHAPELRPFFEKLYEEYLGGDDPVFIGPYMHVGTDEYSSSEAEAFRSFSDWLFKLPPRYGKTSCAWGSLRSCSGKTPVTNKQVLMDVWQGSAYSVSDAIRDGYTFLAVPDDRVYIVPGGGYYPDYPRTEFIFDHWEPSRGYPAALPLLRGSKFALWNDRCGVGYDASSVADRFWRGAQIYGQKMWAGTIRRQTFPQFEALTKSTRAAPSH